MSGKNVRTVGFGVPADEVDPHHFAVIIPRGRADDVMIVERFGIKAGIGSHPEEEVRCVLPRAAWAAISDPIKRVFNERLKTNHLKPSRWEVGEVKVARMLGKELTVLAWAVEKTAGENYGNAIRNWTALKPEERWWLFSMAAGASGRAGDSDVGWRKAIRFGVSEAPSQVEMRLEGGGGSKPSKPKKRSSSEEMPLFEGIG